MAHELPLKLDKTMAGVRLAHPLPEERLSQLQDHVDDLLLPLQKLDAGAWQKLCEHFDERLDPLIFPCFAHVKKDSEIKRLQQLCRSRCSWSLYEQAWSAFCQLFPNRPLQMAFAEIYATLRRDPERYGEAPAYLSHEYLPARVDFSLSPEALAAKSAELFAEYMDELFPQNPHRSGSEVDPLHSISESSSEVLEAAVDRFLKTYSLHYSDRFTAHVMGNYLVSRSERELYKLKFLLENCIQALPQERFVSLVQKIGDSRYLTEEERGPLFEIFYRALEQCANGRDIWFAMPRKTRRVFMRWHIWDVMCSHYALNPRKEKAMKSLVKSILDVSEPDAQTVIWKFEDFYVYDSWEDLDGSLYFPRELFDRLYRNNKVDLTMAPLNTPYRSLREDNFRQAAKGVVRLNFVQPHYDLSLEFLNQQCGIKVRTRKSTFTNWGNESEGEYTP